MIILFLALVTIGTSQQLVCDPVAVSPQFNSSDRFRIASPLRTHLLTVSVPSGPSFPPPPSLLSAIEYATGERRSLFIGDFQSTLIPAPDSSYVLFRLFPEFPSGTIGKLFSIDPLGETLIQISLNSTSVESLAFNSPSISPDSKTVVYATQTEGVSGLYVVAARVPGSQAVRITPDEQTLGSFDSVSWSPLSSRRIAYRYSENGIGHLFVLNLDNVPIGPVQLSTTNVLQSFIKWSFSGRQLTWTGAEGGENNRLDVFVADFDGANLASLDSEAGATCLGSEFTPDDSAIVFECAPEQDPTYSLWAAPASGGNASAYRISNNTESIANFRYIVPPAHVIILYENTFPLYSSAWIMDARIATMAGNRRLTPEPTQELVDAGARGVERLSATDTNLLYIADLQGDFKSELLIVPLAGPPSAATQVSPEGESVFFFGPASPKTLFQTDGGAYVVQEGEPHVVERLSNDFVPALYSQTGSASAAFSTSDGQVFSTCIYSPTIISANVTLTNDTVILGHLEAQSGSVVEVVGSISVFGSTVIEPGTTLVVDSCESGEQVVVNTNWVVGQFGAVSASCDGCMASVLETQYSSSSLSVVLDVQCPMSPPVSPGDSLPPSTRGGLSTGQIVGIAVGSIVGGLLIALLLILLMNRLIAKHQEVARREIVDRDTENQLHMSPRGAPMRRPASGAYPKMTVDDYYEEGLVDL